MAPRVTSASDSDHAVAKPATFRDVTAEDTYLPSRSAVTLNVEPVAVNSTHPCVELGFTVVTAVIGESHFHHPIV